MRHLKAGRALGVKPAHRRAMMRNLVTSLLEHEQLTTTVARAKELRIPLEKMITLGKKGDLAARRRALRFVKSKKAMQALFDVLPQRYTQRAGGYCRILRLGRRRGDGAELALIQLLDSPHDAQTQAEKPASGRGRRRGAGEQGGKKAKTAAPIRKDKADPGTEGSAPAKKSKGDPGTEGSAPAKKSKSEPEPVVVESAVPAKKSKGDPGTEGSAPAKKSKGDPEPVVVESAAPAKKSKSEPEPIAADPAADPAAAKPGEEASASAPKSEPEPT